MKQVLEPKNSPKIKEHEDEARTSVFGSQAGTPSIALNEAKRNRLAIIAIIAVYALVVGFIGPQGNFPLNDDWVYAIYVREFLESGSMDFDLSSIVCFMGTIWGALICKLFGFSHDILRLSTIFATLISGCALFLLLRELKAGLSLAMLSTFVYLLNPLLLNVSFSFMTDSYSLCGIALYMLFMVRGLMRNSSKYLLASSFALCSTIAFRNTAAIFLLVNFAIALHAVFHRKPALSFFLHAFVLPLTATFALEKLGNDAVVNTYAWNKAEFLAIANKLLRHTGKESFLLLTDFGKTMLYMGLFLAPALLPALGSLVRKSPKYGLFKRPRPSTFLWVASASIVVATLTFFIVHKNVLMPASMNILRIPALGAQSIMGINFALLSDGHRLLLTQITGGLAFLLMGLVIFSISIAAICVLRAFLRRRSSMRVSGAKISDYRYSRSALLLFSLMAISLPLLFCTLHVKVLALDRYYLMALPATLFALALAVKWLGAPPRAFVLTGWSLFFALGYYSVAAQQDYMSWNRARYHCLDSLLQKGVEPAEIDGGAEFNYTNRPSLNIDTLQLRPGVYGIGGRGNAPRSDWRWWPILDDDRYIVSFSTIPDYDLIEKAEYWSALSLSKRPVYLLQRIENASPQVDSGSD